MHVCWVQVSEAVCRCRERKKMARVWSEQRGGTQVLLGIREKRDRERTRGVGHVAREIKECVFNVLADRRL